MNFCGLHDDLIGQAGGQLCRLRNFEFFWAVVDGLPGVSDDLLIRTYADAWQSWAAKVGIRPKYTEDARSADILIGSRVIDGSGGVLAEAQLPCGNYPRQLRSWFDRSETWRVVGGTPTRRGIPLYLTAAHEFGHHLGIGHLSGNALMAPTLNTNIDGPQSADIAEALARYGPVIAVPLPPPTTPAPTMPPPWTPTTPPPTIPGAPMDRTALKNLIGTVLSFVSFLAKFTPTQVDDRVVVLLTAAISNDALLDFLVGLLNKVPATTTDPQVVLAVLQAHLADAEAIAALRA